MAPPLGRWERRPRPRHGVALAYLNVVGGQDALVFDGASVLADGDGVVHPAAAAFVDQWLVADFNGDTRKFSPVQWAGDGDESRDALAWRAIVRGTRDYCRKNGFDKACARSPGGAVRPRVRAWPARSVP